METLSLITLGITSGILLSIGSIWLFAKLITGKIGGETNDKLR